MGSHDRPAACLPGTSTHTDRRCLAGFCWQNGVQRALQAGRQPDRIAYERFGECAIVEIAGTSE